MCSKLGAAGCGSLWALLQRYPREHELAASMLEDGRLVQVAGAIVRKQTKAAHVRYTSSLELGVEIHPEHIPEGAPSSPNACPPIGHSVCMLSSVCLLSRAAAHLPGHLDADWKPLLVAFSRSSPVCYLQRTSEECQK